MRSDGHILGGHADPEWCMNTLGVLPNELERRSILPLVDALGMKAPPPLGEQWPSSHVRFMSMCPEIDLNALMMIVSVKLPCLRWCANMEQVFFLPCMLVGDAL